MAIMLQVIGAGFVLFMLYICFSHYKRKEFALGDLFLWGFLWLVLLFLVLFPNYYEFLFGGLKVQGALQFIILLSIGVLYVISFFTYTRSRRNEARLQKLVSELASREAHYSSTSSSSSSSSKKSDNTMEDKKNDST